MGLGGGGRGGGVDPDLPAGGAAGEPAPVEYHAPVAVDAALGPAFTAGPAAVAGAREDGEGRTDQEGEGGHPPYPLEIHVRNTK
ncbi:hypothetical protein Pve01_02210 [Planomonospora venezuelensis]|nr:hypothetical protein Pve01_02210 [Planomonospora venezuelensis]